MSKPRYDWDKIPGRKLSEEERQVCEDILDRAHREAEEDFRRNEPIIRQLCENFRKGLGFVLTPPDEPDQVTGPPPTPQISPASPAASTPSPLRKTVQLLSQLSDSSATHHNPLASPVTSTPSPLSPISRQFSDSSTLHDHRPVSQCGDYGDDDDNDDCEDDNEYNDDDEDDEDPGFYEIEPWQPKSSIAIQQHTEELKQEGSSSVSSPRQLRQRITSFKDALEVPLQAKEPKTAEVAPFGTTLLQLFYDKFIDAQSTTWENTHRILATYPRFCCDKLIEGIDDSYLRNMLGEKPGREGVQEMFALIASDVEAKSRLAAASHDRQKPKFYAVLGGPGSGKSTICALWAKLDSSVVHIAIGDILRAEAQRPDSPYAEVLKANLANGAIGDPMMTVALIKDHIRTNLRSATVPIRTYLLDGFPRAFASAQYFEQAMAPISKFIVVDIVEDTLIARCRQRNRSDDDEEAIRKRILVYNTKCFYVIERYSEQGKVHRVCPPSDKLILGGMGLLSTQMDDYLPVDIPETVFRDVVNCGILLWKFCDIRDGGGREFPYF
ncbi:adenylate kinase-domain-containing protein [Pseudoneurospora amorphoporcata]|uniref:Adenylate kinase-domain-containing protein n=1 Tax=Pseudoneurospora amorphoporcata TaxID=241081 RepID=A0AAN6NLF5_9PEZI|nr:adenylate kinase-domain-containing protein [Pseudoneurospora amorphoporcata]